MTRRTDGTCSGSLVDSSNIIQLITQTQHVTSRNKKTIKILILLIIITLILYDGQFTARTEIIPAQYQRSPLRTNALDTTTPTTRNPNPHTTTDDTQEQEQEEDEQWKKEGDEGRDTARIADHQSEQQEEKVNNDDQQPQHHENVHLNFDTPSYNLFHQNTHEKICSLVNESTLIKWETRKKHDNFKAFLDLFDYDKEDTEDTNLTMKIWNNPIRHMVSARLCTSSMHFKETGSIKKHVLISHLNENWGALSTYVPNRTVNWNSLEDNLKREGCNVTDIMTYLNHENTLGVVTVQHQAFDHPKVHSLPLGLLHDPSHILDLIKEPPLNRTQLLMVNSARSKTRSRQIDTVLNSFNGTGLENTYGSTLDEYHDELRRSKFIMCPSGMGWDTYRLWEALYLGAIPVVERYNRQDGWQRTLDNLPIVWVETFEELNPEFLEREYEKIVTTDFSKYNFEKLTIPYWKSFVESLLPDSYSKVGDTLSNNNDEEKD